MAIEDEDGLFPGAYGGSKGIDNWGDVISGAGGILGSLLGSKTGDNRAYSDLLKNSKRSGDKVLGGMDQFMETILSQTASQFGKANAIADSQGAIQNIFDEFSKTALPSIYQSEVGSGGYNGTTSQLMANDAFAQTTNKAAALMMDTIMKYRTSQQNDYNTFGGLGRSVPNAPAQPSAAKGGGGGGLGSLIGPALGAIFGSDRRLKDNIKATGTYNGHNTYEFTYKADPHKLRYSGVMADEVLETHPEAVTVNADGFYAVNYNKIGVPFKLLSASR